MESDINMRMIIRNIMLISNIFRMNFWEADQAAREAVLSA